MTKKKIGKYTVEWFESIGRYTVVIEDDGEILFRFNSPAKYEVVDTYNDIDSKFAIERYIKSLNFGGVFG